MSSNIENTVSTETWIAFISMVFGMFMAILDIQIVASSLREIQSGLSSTQDEINWVQSSYLIAEVIIIPICGWLCKAFSTRIVFSISCAGFTIMSLACALAWNLESMIIFRALQGFFGGAMIPTVFATIFVVFPPKMRPNVTVVIGLVVTVAPITGPIIGGYITDYLSWPYLFLLNIIPGILVTFFVFKLVNFDQAKYELLQKIDFIGIFLIIICLGTLQYTLEEGTKKQWFDSNLICLLFSISLLSGIIMIYREWIIEHPVINLHAFRDRNFTCGCIFSFVLGWGLYTAVFLLPIYLGFIKGLNSLQIGEYLFVTGVFQLLSAPVAGILSKKIDLRLMLATGMFLFGLGCYMNTNITYESGFDEFFLPQAVRGFSLMLCFLPITSLTFATLNTEEVHTASGLYNLMRNLGGAIGLAVTNTLLQDWTKRNYSHLRDNVNYNNDAANYTYNLIESNLTSVDYVEPGSAAIKMITQLAEREAYIITFNQVFFIIALLFFASVLLMPIVQKLDLNKKDDTTV